MLGANKQNKILTHTDSEQLDTHIDLQLSLNWQSEQGHHTETRVFYGLDRKQHLDQLPPALQSQILNQTANTDGLSGSMNDSLPEPDNGRVKKIDKSQFKQPFHGRIIIPRIGRFYPQTIIEGITNILSGSLPAMRLIDADETQLVCDFNHPLAGFNFEVSAKVISISGTASTYMPAKRDPFAELLSGPGMQVRAQAQSTDFFSGDPFRRKDETSDAAFYHMPRMTDHLDKTALKQVEKLYGSLVPQNADILDLMSSTNSHLPDAFSAAKVTGLGMNQQELESNPQLSTRLVHDLNSNPKLPFSSASFDAVICTVSVEYLTMPMQVFHEVNRVLKPGGIFITSFSNRWFPPKVIDLWTELHEFERMGLVSEYFLQNGNYDRVDTFSIQGFRRPQDDHYAQQLPWSDPVYAVWSHKKLSNDS